MSAKRLSKENVERITQLIKNSDQPVSTQALIDYLRGSAK